MQRDTDDNIQTPLHLVSFFVGMPEDLRSIMSNAGHIAHYKKGQIIHQEGDPGEKLSIIKTGSVRFSNTDREGNINVLSVLEEGEAFGELPLFAGIPRAYDAAAAQDCDLRVISKTELGRLMDDEPRLRDHIIRHVTRQFYRALQLLDDERRLPLKVRLAKNLVTRSAVQAGKTEIRIRQDELADELAVSRVAMGKALSHLSQQGLVRTGYGKVEILGIEALSSWIAEASKV